MPQLSLQHRAELENSNPYLWHLGSFNERQSKFNADATRNGYSIEKNHTPLNNNLLQIEEEVPQDKIFEPMEESKEQKSTPIVAFTRNLFQELADHMANMQATENAQPKVEKENEQKI